MIEIESMKKAPLEDMQNICDLLLPVLQATKRGRNIDSLSYHKATESVAIGRKGGVDRIVRVKGCNGLGLIWTIAYSLK